jgi:ZIP family zinc transporter
VVLAKPILPYALAFAAGAMIFVVAEELVPEAKRGSPDIAAMSVMVGFAVMMTLDVALGYASGFRTDV